MPGPSDIRVNPFNNATNYVNLTERHIVPSVSPFVVRLNEVPEKQDPSNMQMFYVDDTTGQTTETALTEVAATPGAGEFRPDYSTNAFDDTSWNTGLIEFSSADAGKIIEVSYTATGTLAGVKTNRYPAWWTDRGDGSDGDFAPESNVTIGGEYNYKNVFIKNGITVTVSPHALLKCNGIFINNGTISAKGQGAAGGGSNSSGSNGMSNGNGRAGASDGHDAGGAGGSGNYWLGFTGAENYTESIVMALKGYCYGAGGGGGRYGGKGGNGGGSLAIVAKSVFNTGSINANGGDGNNGGAYGGGGGGGAGGSVVVVADCIIDNGTIESAGGAGGGGKVSAGAGESGFVFIKELGAE